MHHFIFLHRCDAHSDAALQAESSLSSVNGRGGMYRPLDLEDTGADYPTAATLRSRVSGWTAVSATAVLMKVVDYISLYVTFRRQT